MNTCGSYELLLVILLPIASQRQVWVGQQRAAGAGFARAAVWYATVQSEPATTYSNRCLWAKSLERPYDEDSVGGNRGFLAISPPCAKLGFGPH